MEAPDGAAQQGIGVTLAHHQRADHGVARAHHGARIVRRDALALGQAVIEGPILVVARIAFRIDQRELLALADAQAELLDPPLHHGAPADQDRLRQLFVDHGLDRAQHALFLALGIDHFLAVAARALEQRLHQEAGAEHELVQPVAIGRPVGDRPRRDAAVHRRLGDRRRDLHDQARIERPRDQVVAAEGRRLAAIGVGDDVGGFGLGEIGDRLDAGDLHFLIDRRRADIDRAAEDEGEADDVVDLVRVVRATGRDDGIRPHRLHLFRQDLRRRVGEGEDQRLLAHLLDHVLGQHPRRGQAEEDVGAGDHVGQRARIGLLGIARLARIHQLLAAFIDHADDVGDGDVLDLHAEIDQQVEAGERRRAGAGGDQLHLVDLLAHHLQAVQHRRADDDRRAMLVVVHDRDLHARLELAFDLEALGRLDVFQVDAAEGRLQAGDDVDQLVGIGLVDLDVEHVEIGELLEQDRLAFHHRLGSQRADGAEAEHGRSVGDDGDQVAAAGDFGGGVRIGDDEFAGGRHARGIGQGQVALAGQRLGGDDGEFSGPREAVVFERAGLQIVAGFLGIVCHSVPCPSESGGL